MLASVSTTYLIEILTLTTVSSKLLESPLSINFSKSKITLAGKIMATQVIDWRIIEMKDRFQRTLMSWITTATCVNSSSKTKRPNHLEKTVIYTQIVSKFTWKEGSTKKYWVDTMIKNQTESNIVVSTITVRV